MLNSFTVRNRHPNNNVVQVRANTSQVTTVVTEGHVEDSRIKQQNWRCHPG